MNKIYVNGKYDENNISQLISKFYFLFGFKGRRIKNYFIEVNIDLDDFTSIAALVIYKTFAFIVDEQCLQDPKVNLTKVVDLFTKYHLNELLIAYINEKERDKIYLKIKPVIKEDFFIAPHYISRTSFKNFDEIEKKYYKTIIDYYSDFSLDVVECLKTLIVEISSNFYSHATDENSILMAEGNNKKIEIISVDTSQGIIGTMREKFKNESDKLLLKKAFERGISSKMEKGHCGTGLWLVNEIVTKLKGKLILHSGGYVYRNIQGKVNIFASTNWKGTILYVKIPIKEDIGDRIKEILINKIKYI